MSARLSFPSLHQGGPILRRSIVALDHDIENYDLIYLAHLEKRALSPPKLSRCLRSILLPGRQKARTGLRLATAILILCESVNGQTQHICENAVDLRPICPLTVCNTVPPSVRPIGTPTVPPIGTTSCAPQQVQVQNVYTGQYEWKTVCR